MKILYVVAPLTSDTPEKILHRDLVLPCGLLAPSMQDEINLEPKKEPTGKTSQKSSVSVEEEVENPYENHEEEEYHYPQTVQEKNHLPDHHHCE